MNQKERLQELSATIKKLENENEELKARIRSAERSSAEMIFKAYQNTYQLMALSKTDTGVFVDVNLAFLNTLGYRKEEVVGQTSEDIGLFADIAESSKYLNLLSKLKKIKDYTITLRTRAGDVKPFLYTAETILLEGESYLMSIFIPIITKSGVKIKESHGNVLEEIFNTVSSYLALFTVGEDDRFYVVDINSKVEEIEFIDKNDVVGKCICDTQLIGRIKLLELLNHLRVTGEAHKLSVSDSGDDSEGYYMGFPLSSGNIVITWEPGHQQKIEDDIQKQSVLFRTFAELLPGIIYELDLDGKILFGNKPGRLLFGVTPGDFERGMYIKDVFPDSSSTMMKNLDLISSPEEISSNEYMVTKPDGTTIPIVTHSFGIFHEGRKVGYRGTITDLSRYKRYEEQIIREKAFLEHLIDSTPEAIVITDYPGRITMVNKEFTSLFGYTQEDAVNKMINDLIIPEDFRDDALDFDTLSTPKEKIVRQTVRSDKYGNKINVSMVATAITVNSKTVAYLVIYRDITSERKSQLLQEILFNISNAALKETDIKEIYPTIVSELSKIWDTNNFFIALYDKANNTLSLPFFTDEKDEFNEIPITKTITGWVIKNNRSVLLKENDLKALEETGEVDLVGSPCKVWMGIPLVVEGSIIGVMCLQDYNDEDKFSQDDLYILNFIANQIATALQRRLMLDNIIAARQRAEEAAQAKQIFMSTMSHEIRTPLNEVIGITNLLLQGNPREDQMDYIKTLRFSGNHLLTLVNDVLDYNKMESGKIVFEQTQFNLNDFMEEIMRSYSFRSKAQHLNFEIIRKGTLPAEVIGDPIRLNQILSNLLSNALKFTREGGITVEVKESERNGNQSRLEFSVTDTGIGIPKEKHEAIFESFTQASPDTTRNYGGTGLGLAICKKLVELQGGSIRIESEPGKGSTFTFTIVLAVSEKGKYLSDIEKTESYKGLEGKKILVAEDNKINFFVANKFLTGWGVIVSQAENGRIALDMIEKQDFDLILMDLHMPVMDGIEATRIIRNSGNPKIKSIPIVALTAAIISENSEKIEELHIDDYVLKPFKPHDLFERILKHIR